MVLLGAAVLAWPGSRSLRRARWADLVDGRSRERRPRRRGVAVPPPLACGIGVAAAAASVTTPLVAALAGAGAAGATRAQLRRRAAAREEARLDALTESLAALAAELRSGRSLDGATSAAAAACADADSGRALAQAVRAPALPGGRDRPVAAGGPEVAQALRRVSAAVVLSVRTGCSLAAVVGAVEDDLRARRRQRHDLRSATAGARASSALLAGLPVLALAMGGGVGADPWRVLTATGPGQLLLVVGVALEAAGLAWSGRLVRRAVR
nr:pilus assembly protein TadB [Geodermatophilus sabuli]